MFGGHIGIVFNEISKLIVDTNHMLMRRIIIGYYPFTHAFSEKMQGINYIKMRTKNSVVEQWGIYNGVQSWRPVYYDMGDKQNAGNYSKK